MIPVVKEITPEIWAMAGQAGTALGYRGMLTKLEAARIATGSGIPMVLAAGKDPGIINRITGGEQVGTLFYRCGKFAGRKRWIAFAGQPRGQLVIDNGAVEALTIHKKSLLPSGVVGVKGQFNLGDLVSIVDSTNREIARGLSNFSAVEIMKIMGKKSKDIIKILGHKSYDEVVHRDNLVCLE